MQVLKIHSLGTYVVQELLKTFLSSILCLRTLLTGHFFESKEYSIFFLCLIVIIKIIVCAHTDEDTEHSLTIINIKANGSCVELRTPAVKRWNYHGAQFSRYLLYVGIHF